ncbi:MAG TPA: hypothetical protein VM925_37460 [Labilithrix sp.]|nr:hypothetical protein [Labilithrix sp.]
MNIRTAAALVLFASGCAELRSVVAPSDDLEDYRAFRVAAADGTRLARAKRYLDRHPKGTWAAEVRAVFDEEEPRYFERAQRSREAARRYLADLPDGPHAEAALALLIAFGSSMEDAELRDLARRVRFDDTKLEAAAVQRRAVGTGILDAVGVLLDDDVYGVPLAETPAKLRAILVGPSAPTWGGVPSRREIDHFFLLPTRPDRESRLLTLEIAIIQADGLVVGGKVEGSDMLVRWAEADQIVRLDSSSAEDRTEAQVHAMARLEGAFERRFPSASCQDLRKDRELYHRACDGWEAVVLSGTKAGDKDAIVITSPRGRKAGLEAAGPSSSPSGLSSGTRDHPLR